MKAKPKNKKTAPKKLTKKDVNDFRKQAKKIIDGIAAKRCELEDLMDEYEDVLSATAGAEEYFTFGLEELNKYL